MIYVIFYTMDDKTDSELVRLYLDDGNQEALNLIIKRHLKSVYRFIFGFIGDVATAEDISQEAFIKVWKNLKKFDQNRNFKTWILSIAKNTMIDYTRKKKALPFSFFEDIEGENKFEDSVVDSEPLSDELFDKNLNQEKIIDAISKLPTIYRSVITLRFSEGLKFDEIAEVFGESINTIKSRGRRAEALLKEYLKRT